MEAGERKTRLKSCARRELQRTKPHLHLSEKTETIQNPKHADLRDIAFQECIGRLRRRMRDESDVCRLNAVF